MSDLERADVGANLRLAREARGWSLRQMAAASGISVSRLCSLEHGANPTLGTLVAIAQAIGQPVEWFLRPVECCPTCKRLWPEKGAGGGDV